MRKAMGFVGILLGATALAWLTGCGGGSGTGDSGTLRLYVMDSFSDDYPQVWATLRRIEVSAGGSSWRTVYDDADGVELNLPELADTAEMLGEAAVPPGSYVRARLTLRNTMRLMHRNGSAADVPLRLSGNGFGPGPNDTCMVEFPIACSVAGNGQTDLLIDFDLPHFGLDGGQLQARIQQGDANRFRAMHKRGRVAGQVANLEPGVAFDLIHASRRSVHVALTDATTIVQASDGQAGTLANGQFVFVTGTWDPTAGVLTATVVVIMDIPVGTPRPAHVRGTVLEVDGAAKTFVVEPLNAFMNFRPMAQRVKVTTTDSTLYGFVPRGPATFDDVTVGAKVDVMGAYDGSSDSIVARRVLVAR